MGFGTLFFGYFLLLNITYFHFTDLIAALVMLLGIYKLMGVSAPFRAPFIAGCVFGAVGIFELGLGIFELFGGEILPDLITYTAIARSVVICILTVLLLRAMREIAISVELERVPLRCRTMTIWTMLLYALNVLLQSPAITSALPDGVAAGLYLTYFIGVVIVVILNLSIIYTCYMRICMPEDLEGKKEKPSRFAFINEYRRRRDERAAKEREEALARLEEKRRKKKK
ncbi:MAG: hypothetical protein IKC32_04005 [Clostridia bacterium]|nr:hypothetical protein [Clostridia bacterium]